MPTGRYAPSPTGSLHVGNLRTAIAAWLCARSTDSAFRLRWEDLDHTADPRHESSQLADLTELGLDFDGPALRQSDRLEAYTEIVADLERRGLTYPCWCSRREIREAAAAPHGATVVYPGTCRNLTRAEIAQRQRDGRPPALRLRSDGEAVTIIDTLHGPVERAMDDIVLRRGDGVPAYNLVVVVDDALQEVAEVVRGDDLLDSTPRQVYLQRLLDLPEPRWTHVPLVVDVAGDRLAKRDGSAGLDAWRAAGGSPGSFVAAAARTLGIDCPTGTAALTDLVDDFDVSRLPSIAAVFAGTPELSLAR